MAQSQAAILAIIVSLTLVAVQISAQRFSPRITSIFSKQKSLWVLIGFFSFSIIYDVLLIWIANNIGYKGTLIGIILMISAFLSLFIYIKSVIETLKPHKIIKLISNDIKIKKIDLFLSNMENVDEDPLIVILDIINGAIELHDQITIINGVNGLKTIFKKTVHYFDEHYPVPLGHSTDYSSNYDKNDDLIVYFGELVTDIAMKCIKNKLFTASIYTIDSISAMFEVVAILEGENKDTAGNFIHNLAVIDSEVNNFLDEEGYKGNMASGKTIKLISRPIIQIGETTSIAIKNKHDSVAIDFGINLLQSICDYYFSLQPDITEFKSFSDLYEENHPFKGSFRLHAAINSLIKINLEIVKNLPDLDEDDLNEFLQGSNYNEKSYLHVYQQIVVLLQRYGTNAMRWNFVQIYEVILKNLKNDLFMLTRKNFDQVQDPNLLKTISEAISSILTNRPDSDYIINDYANYIQNVIGVLKLLIEKQSSSFSNVFEILLNIYSFAFDYEPGQPTGPLRKSTFLLGNLGLFCIDNGNLRALNIISKSFMAMINNFVQERIFWINFTNFLIKYFALWVLELKKQDYNDFAEELIHQLKEIENIFEMKISQGTFSSNMTNIVLNTLDEVFTSKNFRITVEEIIEDPESNTYSYEYPIRQLNNDEEDIFESIIDEISN